MVPDLWMIVAGIVSGLVAGATQLYFPQAIRTTAGSNRRMLGDPTKSNEDPRWTIDGERVLFLKVPLLERLPGEALRDFIQRRALGQQLVSVKPDGQDARVVPPEEGKRISRDRGSSPDGKWTVYSRDVEGVPGLYLRELSSGTERLPYRAGR